MLSVRRRLYSAARAFDFSQSRDVVGAPAPPAPVSDSKRPPSARVRKLVSEILDLSLIEAADLCDLCQEQLASRSTNPGYPSALFAAQMAQPMMAFPQAAPAPAAPAAAPAAPAPAAAPAAPEQKAIVSIKLVAFDSAKKVQTVKEVRAITNLGLKEAKDAVEADWRQKSLD